MRAKVYAVGRRRLAVMAKMAAMTALLAGLAAPARATATGELDPWKPSGGDYWIAGPLRLNLGFTDQTGTPRVAVASSLQPGQLAGLPDGLAQATNSDLFQAGHFEALWTAMKSGVCTDVQKGIQNLVNHSPNTAYDLMPCVMNPKGYLTATFQESWTNDAMQNVNGRRIRFNYLVPLNGVTFWVTSPHTCHHGDTCPTEPQDPNFTVVFTADIAVTCTSMTPNATAFVLPANCTPATAVVVDAVVGGDVTGQVVGAAEQWSKQVVGEAASVAATGGASLPEAAAAFIAQGVNVAVKGIGAAIAAVTDQHLRDQVSAWISGSLGSGTLNANCQNISNDFNTLFQNLYFANLGGLKPFAFGIEVPDLDLDFGLVYPLPAKPVVQNTTANNNKTSLFATSIAVTQPQVIAGQTIPVTCNYFRGAYVNVLNIAWNKTVLGTAKSTLEWGPPKVQITTPAQTFDATNLSPATKYGFTVHECDGLTCAPWSEVLWTATEAAGSNIVSFWLDNNTSQIIGKTTIGTNGYTFQANLTIPAATSTGTHVLHAGQTGSQPASATINVCQAGGCGPFIGVVNPQNNAFYPSGSLVGVGNSVVVRGSKFAPGGSVWIWVDGVQGTHAGTAPVGPLGNFQAKFNMPLIQAGNHTFFAVELKPGVKLLPTPKGKAPSYPPQDFVTASVAIFVEAAVQ
jgi:hypothetical protein